MRPLRAAILAISLVTALAVSALWVRSHRRFGEALVYRDFDARPNPHGRDFPVWHVYSFCSFRGRLGVERLVYQDKRFLTDEGVYRRDPLYIPRYGPTPWATHGFSTYTGVRDDVRLGPGMEDYGSETHITGVTAPHWAVLVACALPAAWILARAALRRRAARRRGFPLDPAASPASPAGPRGS